MLAKLRDNSRKMFNGRQVPSWVKAAVFLLIAVLLYSFTVLPSAIKTGIAYERGNKAQREKRHITAIREYEKVVKRYPDFTPVLARLAVSYFYSERINECSRLLERIADREVTGSLAEEVNGIVGKLSVMYFENNGLKEALRLYGQEELEKTAVKLTEYLRSNNGDVLGMLYLANIYFDIGRYNEAEGLYRSATDRQPEFASAYLNLAALYRETGEYDKAAENCRKVLEFNAEHPQAYMSLSRLELARHRSGEGLEYAEKAYEYGGEDINAAANLCLAYHYNGMREERDRLFEQLKQNKYRDVALLQSAFEGKVDLR